MPSTRYEAIIAAGTDSGIGEYTKDWVRASTNVSKCEGKTSICFFLIEAVQKAANMFGKLCMYW